MYGDICSWRVTRRRVSWMVMGMVSAMTMACHGMLDVSDPTLVRDPDIANAEGANARRLNALGVFTQTASALAVDVARFSDEWVFDIPAGQTPNAIDVRDSQGYEQAAGTTDRHLGLWDQVYYQTSIAIPAVRAYTPDSLKGDFLGHLYGMRGYAVLQIAEDVCPGFPLNDVSPDNRPLFSGPLSTDSALALANAELDSAVKYVRDSVRFVTLARVAKGRALLDEGKYSEAAAVVAVVPTDAVYQTESVNQFYAQMRPGRWRDGDFNVAVGDREGGNGLPYVSANDPRIPLAVGGASATNALDTLYITTKYTAAFDPITLASGVEARLIEAEAALNAGDPNWLTILNTLRATVGLSALSDPGPMAAQVDLLYSERAFWLYMTGRRLGDLRRLVRNYGRNPETVFPSGPGYGNATAFPFVLAAEQVGNPYITAGCTSR